MLAAGQAVMRVSRRETALKRIAAFLNQFKALAGRPRAPNQRCHITVMSYSNSPSIRWALPQVIQHRRDRTMSAGNGHTSFSTEDTPPSHETQDDGAVGKAVAAVAVVAVG